MPTAGPGVRARAVDDGGEASVDGWGGIVRVALEAGGEPQELGGCHWRGDPLEDAKAGHRGRGAAAKTGRQRNVALDFDGNRGRAPSGAGHRGIERTLDRVPGRYGWRAPRYRQAGQAVLPDIENANAQIEPERQPECVEAAAEIGCGGGDRHAPAFGHALGLK